MHLYKIQNNNETIKKDNKNSEYPGISHNNNILTYSLNVNHLPGITSNLKKNPEI